MMLLNLILKKCTGRYKLYKSQEKNQSPNVQEQDQTVCQKWKELETLILAVKICSEDVRMEFAIEKCGMLIMKSGKQQTTEGIKGQNQEKNQNTRGKENL